MRLVAIALLCAGCGARSELGEASPEAGATPDVETVPLAYKVAFQSVGDAPIMVWHSRDGSIEQLLPYAHTMGEFTYDGRFMSVVGETTVDVVDSHGATVRSQPFPADACGSTYLVSTRPDAQRMIVSSMIGSTSLDTQLACFGTLDASGAYNPLDKGSWLVSPRYAPDGQTMVFAEEVLDHNVYVSKVFMMRDDGSERVVLAASGGMPSFSFDGKRVAYLGETGILAMDLASRSVTTILDASDPSSSFLFPLFTPDGTAILFEQVTTYKDASLRRIDLATKEVTTLIEPFGAHGGYAKGASMTLAADAP